MTKLQFCGGCAQLLPVEAERTLTSDSPDPPLAPIYQCDNCATRTDVQPPIEGEFSDEAAEKLRCL